MLIDCDTCAARGAACGGCVMTVLLARPPQIERLDAAEARVLETLARAGFDVTVLADTDQWGHPPAVRPRRHSRGMMAV